MYIVGYGSLINAHSRQLTNNTGESQPVFITGFDRHWSKINGSYSLSPLAVTPGTGGFNGVLINITRDALKQFDEREHGYRRIELSPSNVHLNPHHTVSDPIWMYIKDDVQAPCNQMPIAQSYIDTVLAGCLAISPDFAQQFITTTNGWQHPTMDDRSQPLYGRVAGVTNQHRVTIDELLSKHTQSK